MLLTEHEGDLLKQFETQCAMAHCVSQDLRMGKGIAKQFDMLFSHAKRDLKQQKKQVGEFADHIPFGGPRRIYYLITKEKYFHKPTYESLESCLVAMRNDMIRYQITKLKIPKLGCGLDKLDWDRVKALIIAVFEHTTIHIQVWDLAEL
jgi:O-acetyl-ADP-ribose deacetylase (regulator of RNase III)